MHLNPANGVSGTQNRPRVVQKILLTSLSDEDLSEPDVSQRRSSKRGSQSGHSSGQSRDNAYGLSLIEYQGRENDASPSGTDCSTVITMNGDETFGNAQQQIRVAEHAAKAAQLEAEEWKFHAQSLQASLQRQRHLQSIPSTDSSNPSTPGRMMSLRQGNSESYENLATSNRQQTAHEQDAALVKYMQKYDKLRKKYESLRTSETILMQRLEHFHAENNELRAELDSRLEALDQCNDMIAKRDAQIETLQKQLAQHPRHGQVRPSSASGNLEMDRQNSGAQELEQVKRKLSMERATSRQLQNQLVGKNEEVAAMKSSFKATLEDHRRRQISIGQVLSKLQSSQLKN